MHFLEITMRCVAIVFFMVSAVFCFPSSLPAASLYIQSNAPGAQVQIDGRSSGQTDRNGLAYISDLSPGSHKLSLSLEGYEPHSETIQVHARLTTFLKVSLDIQDKIPPEIRLISPEPSRGITPATLNRDTVQVIGLARDNNGVMSVTVNGNPAVLNAPDTEELKLLPGNTVKFSTKLKLIPGDNRILVEAVDRAGNLTSLAQVIRREALEPDLKTSLNMSCRALLIGISEYRQWPKLANPIFDIQSLDKELKINYGFQTNVLLNPTRSEILNGIRTYYSERFSDNDQLLIVLSGHGYFDDLTKTGYFVSTEGKKQTDDPALESLIPHSVLYDWITNIPCKHILVVIDACFSGTFFQDIALRGEDERYRELPPKDYILKKMQFKTRIAMTSGGKEYVPDGRPGQHSPFMRKFLEGLRSYGGEDKILSVDQLKANYMDRIFPLPRMEDIRGNEPGSGFLFIAK